MAKVSKVNTGKAQGADKPEHNSNSDILVEKDGKRRAFTKLIWDHLPPEKEGWTEVKEIPSEPPAKAVDKVKDPAKVSGKNEPKTKVEKVEDPANPATEGSKEKVKEIPSESTTSKTKTIIVTQEDLDANPEFVEAGILVGDSLEIEEDGEN